MANQPDEHKRTGERPPVFDDKETREKIDRHMRDINDKITEEDIRNINTEPNEHYRVEKDDPEDLKDGGNNLNEENEDSGDTKKGGGGIETPWNILGE